MKVDIERALAQLTGQRFLTGYSSEETQYKALMDAGTTFAQQQKSADYFLSFEIKMLKLKCHNRYELGKKLGLSRKIYVTDLQNVAVPAYELMCCAIDSDIQNSEGSGAQALKEILRIESGETKYIEADGNAWVTHITRGKVWFEGLYSQGEGGEVSFAQYKFAVQIYIRFLSDTDEKSITTDFPEY